MKKEYKIGIHNEFEIVVRDAKTGKVKRRAKSYNIILNQFWTRFLSSNNSACLSYIHFGSGTATPVATDTSLTTFIASKASASISQDVSTFYADGIIKKKCSIRLEDTEYIGYTISEVGFGYSAASSNLMTKSLIKDQNGNPLAHTKAAGEVVDIYATFYVKIPTTINGGKVYFNPSSSPTSGILGFLCCYGALGTSPDGYYNVGYYEPKVLGNPYLGYGLSTVTNTYDVANKKVTIGLSNIVAANGNIGGIESLRMGNMILEFPCEGFAQPVLTKEVIATGDGTTKDFKCSFSRILNNGIAKLYENDVEVSATFDYEHPGASIYISQWMPVLSGKPSIKTAAIELENPFYSKFGVDTIYGKYFNLYASNDRTNWTLAASRSSTTSAAAVTITSTYKNYRYWKIEPYGSSQGWTADYITSADCLANLVVHAASAPASGATVALTYQPRCLAKDASHVLNNMSVVLTFNEYTP